jgi:hypothetical protein
MRLAPIVSDAVGLQTIARRRRVGASQLVDCAAALKPSSSTLTR